MLYVSTRGKASPVSFVDAAREGLAPDGGLYVPVQYPLLSESFIRNLPDTPLPEIMIEVLKGYVEPDIDVSRLSDLVERSMVFDAPLVSLSDNVRVLELFHGPTQAFKDFGVRFMARLFTELSDRPTTVLTATSGDTGAAVASAFFGLRGIRVVVLYPQGKVSDYQERQIAGLGGNVTALEVRGTFDDCQRLVKQAFSDREVRSKLTLASANSINLARLLPQVAYYFRAVGQLPAGSGAPVFSVPSGNFGNVTAGLIAMRMGLPAAFFVAATNVNDSVPRFLRTGVFEPHPVVETISNAMDIAEPSNFSRILAMYGADVNRLSEDMRSASFTDAETMDAIREVENRYGYVPDPHGAVAYLGLKRFAASRPGIFLETAHPVKFADTIEKCLGRPVEGFAMNGSGKKSTVIEASYDAMRAILMTA